MKISRQSDLSESYKITCDWLDEFANNIAKSANLEHLDGGDRQSILNSSARFGTIDSKMADIKSRIGFEQLMREANYDKLASASCECNDKSNACSCEIKTASKKHSAEDIEAMKQILVYIRDLVKHEPHLDRTSIISRCRLEDGLHFRDLPINVSSLNKYIDGLIEKTHGNPGMSQVTYIPQEPITVGNSDDIQADYYQHANPTA